MTAQNLQLNLVPMPTSQIFQLVQTQGLLSSVLALNGISSLAQVTLAQQDAVGGGRDLHSFVLKFADASYFVSEIEYLSGNLADPVINSESSSGTFHKNEWATALQIRDQILDAHNALAFPSLLQLLFATAEQQIDLTLSATTGSAGVGTFTCTYAAPFSGHLDYLALFHTTDANSVAPVESHVITDFSASGTKTFNMPASTGTYEVRYLVGNSFASLEKSHSLVVS